MPTASSPITPSPILHPQRPVSIERVRAWAVRTALPRPVGAGVSPLATRDYLCLEVTASDGVTGIGFSYIGTRGAESALAVFVELVRPVLEACSADADDPAAVHLLLNEATKIQGRSGIVMNVISAVDIALWDAAARRRDLTLAACLGARATSVAAYASGGYYLSADGLPELEDELRAWTELGFTRMKLKMRGGSEASETERLRMARSALGDEGLLLIDLYHAFQEKADAVAFARRAEAFRPYWIEDPFQPDDVSAFAWFARQVGCHVATGEFQSNPVAFRHIASTGAASIIQAEAPRCGGVTGWLTLAAEMATAGLAMSPCWFHQLHMHLVPAVANGLFVEYFHGTDVLNFDLLIDEPPRVTGSRVLIPERPGLGFGFDGDFIAAHAAGTVDARVPGRS